MSDQKIAVRFLVTQRSISAELAHQHGMALQVSKHKSVLSCHSEILNLEKQGAYEW